MHAIKKIREIQSFSKRHNFYQNRLLDMKNTVSGTVFRILGKIAKKLLKSRKRYIKNSFHKKLLCQNIFSGYVEGCFDNLLLKNSPNDPKIFRLSSEKFWKIQFSQKKHFCSKRFSGCSECSFDNPVEFFPPKVWKKFRPKMKNCMKNSNCQNQRIFLEKIFPRDVDCVCDKPAGSCKQKVSKCPAQKQKKLNKTSFSKKLPVNDFPVT